MSDPEQTFIEESQRGIIFDSFLMFSCSSFSDYSRITVCRKGILWREARSLYRWYSWSSFLAINDWSWSHSKCSPSVRHSSVFFGGFTWTSSLYSYCPDIWCTFWWPVATSTYHLHLVTHTCLIPGVPISYSFVQVVLRWHKLRNFL